MSRTRRPHSVSREVCTDTRQLLLLAECDRHRISRLLHDEVGQLLTAILLNLEFWRHAPLPEEERAGCVKDLKRALAMVRDASLQTRSSVIDCGGLVPALRHLLAGYAQSAPVTLEFDHSAMADVLPESLEVAAFQLLRHAVSSALERAGVRKVTLRLISGEGMLTATLEDDAAESVPASLSDDRTAIGRGHMLQIAHAIGGSIEIESMNGGGRSVRLLVPIA